MIELKLTRLQAKALLGVFESAQRGRDEVAYDMKNDPYAYTSEDIEDFERREESERDVEEVIHSQLEGQLE